MAPMCARRPPASRAGAPVSPPLLMRTSWKPHGIFTLPGTTSGLMSATAAQPSASLAGTSLESHKAPLPALMLGAVGVVYGDIGTSPLYAMKESFIGPH